MSNRTESYYTDEFRAVRIDRGPKDKSFWLERMENGQWIKGEPRGPLPLYKTADLPSTGAIFVCEGPKCAEKFRELGYACTTSACGSLSARKSDWGPLASRDVVIFPDNDQPGAKYANDVASITLDLDPSADLKIATLPGLPDAGDICDFVERCESGGLSQDEIKAKIDKAANEARQVDAKMLAASRDSTSAPATSVGRNDTLFKYAHRLRDGEIDGNALYRQFQKANRQHFEQPLPDRELRSIVKSVMKKRPLPSETPPVRAYQAFPVNALPEPFAAFVREASESIACDPSYVALPVLSVLAACIGTTSRIYLKRDWAEPAILWICVIGESGTAKSPAIDAILRFPRQLEDQEAARFRREMAAYKRQAAAAKSSDELPPEPQRRRMLCGDVTIEALASLLGENPRGMLVCRDELVTWFNSHDRYAGSHRGDVGAWLELHGGLAVTVDRKTGPERSIFVPCSAVSVLGGIQPSALRDAIGTRNIENGLAARFLMAYPPRRPRRWREDEIGEETKELVASTLSRLLKLSMVWSPEGVQGHAAYTLSAEAMLLWVEFYDEHDALSVGRDSAEEAAYSKLQGGCARIALILHLAEHAAGGGIEAPTREVSGNSMRAAITLARWFRQESERVYAMLAESEAQDRDRRVMEIVNALGGRCTANDLRRKRRLFGTVEEAEEALASLVERGLGRWEEKGPGPQGGRPTREFVLLDDAATETHDEGFSYGNTPVNMTFQKMAARAWATVRSELASLPEDERPRRKKSKSRRRRAG